jgi:O-succinylbenzoate synthase
LSGELDAGAHVGDSDDRQGGQRDAELAARLGIEGIDRVIAFEVPLVHRFRRVRLRHGLLLHGRAGWGEWSPFDEYSDEVAGRWLDAALDAAREPAPTAHRTAIAVNVTVPALDPERAHALVATSGCTTAKVKVAEPGQDLGADIERVMAVRDALGPDGRLRIDANGAWTPEEAMNALIRLDAAAGGLEYVEQPCGSLEELATVRRAQHVPVAADEAIRVEAANPDAVRDAVDIAVIKVAPSGGIHRALAFARRVALPTVVSSALDTSVGLGAGVRLAAALPELVYACGLGTATLLAEDVVRQPLRPVDGMLQVADAMAESALRPDVPRLPERDVEALLARARRAATAAGHDVAPLAPRKGRG